MWTIKRWEVDCVWREGKEWMGTLLVFSQEGKGRWLIPDLNARLQPLCVAGNDHVLRNIDFVLYSAQIPFLLNRHQVQHWQQAVRMGSLMVYRTKAVELPLCPRYRPHVCKA